MSVHTTPGGTYEVRWRAPHPLEQGKWIQKQKTFDKFREAMDHDKKVHTQVREGDYIEPSNLTVKEIAEKWLEARRGKKGRWKEQTYLAHKTHVEKYILPAFGLIKATSLRGVDVNIAGDKWREELIAKTVNKIFDDLGNIYVSARKLGVKRSPMPDVERAVDEERSREEMEAEALGAIPDRGDDGPEANPGELRAIRSDEVFTALELKKIIEASAPGLERALLMTEILTGLRHGELNGLRRPNVNLKKGTISINRSLTQLKGGPVLEKPKTKNAYRILKMSPELISELRRWLLQCPPSPNGFVFVDELGRPMNRKSNNRTLKACCERAEVKALSMNNLRHSFASQHLIAGTSPLEVSHMMGHSDPGVTLKIYSRWTDREESKAESALAGRIFGAGEPQESTGSE